MSARNRATPRLEIWAAPLPEIVPGDDLAALIAAATDLQDGDVLVVTSKVVSKAEARISDVDRADAIVAESVRVVANLGAGGVIAATRHGLVMAAAGVDASNTPDGTVVLLPLDPDDSARRLRARLAELAEVNVAVLVSDTSGRAWRMGQTDIAIGAAGIAPLLDLRGTLDANGRELAVTTPAIADELAAAGDLVKGKATSSPVAVVRGLADAVLAPGDAGAGAAALIRPADQDLFGLGVREAVLAAVRRDDDSAVAHFPLPRPDDTEPFENVLDRWMQELPAAARQQVTVAVGHRAPAGRALELTIDVVPDATVEVLLACGALVERMSALATAWRLEPDSSEVDRPVAPGRQRLRSIRWHRPAPAVAG